MKATHTREFSDVVRHQRETEIERVGCDQHVIRPYGQPALRQLASQRSIVRRYAGCERRPDRAGTALQTAPFLRLWLLSSISEHVVRKRGQDIENLRQAFTRPAQNDFLSATQDLNFLDVELKVSGNPYGLRVAATEYLRRSPMFSMRGKLSGC